ncbi:MAG TPA: hypothetical protein P5572_10890 [Phycisphaerae bacterium]|nr:hypothetical protein [Phycisphaerae bacterium]
MRTRVQPSHYFAFNLTSARSMCTTLGILFLAAGTAIAGDLSAADQQVLERTKSALNKLEASLRYAQESAGRGDRPPTGSRAKLAMVRLNSAKQDMAPVEALLAKLPADHPDVQAVQQQYDDDRAAIDALELRLTGKVAGPADAAPAGVKLDYRQEEQLKNARFHTNDVEGKAGAIAQFVEQVQATEDKRLVDFRAVRQALNTLEDADRKVGNARTHLEGLPADGAGVQQVADALAKAVASLEASRTVLVPLNESLSKLIDPAQYPDLQADTKRLSELASMYARPEVLVQDRPQAITLVNEAQAAAAERERLTKAYALLIHQQTEEGKRIAGLSNGFANNMSAFAAAAQQEQAKLPDQIRADLAEVRAIMKAAVEEKKPLYFTGGIPQHLEFADDKLALYAALDPEGAKALADEVAKTRKDVKTAQDALRKDIIAANELPADNYTGADRDAVSALAVKTWKERDPNAEVLAVRIPAEVWKRETLWRFSSDRMYKVDRSKLQVQVVVKHDAELAVIQPINLSKDHLSSDHINAYPFWDRDDELQPQSFLPLAKVKK